MNLVYAILNDELYYCVALTFTCIQAFGIGLAVGYTL